MHLNDELKIIRQESTTSYGNECVIYKVLVLYEILGSYIVEVFTRFQGSWIHDKHVHREYTAEYNTMEEAEQYYAIVKDQVFDDDDETEL